MSENKFTAGPWSIVENRPNENGSTATSIYSATGNYVADVYCGYVGSETMPKDEAAANARLIAAATELFRLVETANNGLTGSHTVSWQKSAQVAIKSVRGES